MLPMSSSSYCAVDRAQKQALKAVLLDAEEELLAKNDELVQGLRVNLVASADRIHCQYTMLRRWMVVKCTLLQ